MLIHIDDFKADLLALKEKYKITIHEQDNYRPDPNDGEVYDGTDQYLVFGKERCYVQTVEQIFEEIFKA